MEHSSRRHLMAWLFSLVLSQLQASAVGADENDDISFSLGGQTSTQFLHLWSRVVTTSSYPELRNMTISTVRTC